MLKVLDLFSGIGGFSLGLERTGGFETVAFCEIDEFCRQILSHHWPQATIYSDVRELTLGRLQTDGIDPDVICGGFPCQDISYAGKRAGLAGANSGLFWQMVRTVRMVRPKYVIVENVAGLATGGLGDVLGAMAGLGYDGEWDCISASDVGADHGRPRIWLVFTDTNGGERQDGRGSGIRRRKRSTKEGPEAAPDTSRNRKLQPPRIFGEVWRRINDGSARAFWSCDWQAKFEALRRMDDGLPTRFHRDRDGKAVRRLGASLLPQIPEMIGYAILEAEGL